MATSAKRGPSAPQKPHANDKRKGEFATLAAGTVGGGSPSSKYSNRGSGATEYRQASACKK